jgi:predicted metal-dependent peptidase
MSKKRKITSHSKSSPDQKTIEEKLTTARIGLLIKQPFFGSMATRLKIVRDDNMSTAATDGRHFFYNLDFIASLSAKQTEFLFGHEVLHNVFEHHIRSSFPDGVEINGHKRRHHMAWNVACDYVINSILIESGIGDRIEDTLYDEKYKGMCSEQVYDLLMKNCTDMDLEALSDMLLDEHMDKLEDKGKGLSEEDKKQIKNEIRESLLASVQASAGNVPAGVDRLVKSLTNPKLSWKDVLRQDIQSVIKNDYTFYRPARKGMNAGIVLPGMKKEEALDVCIAIDCSGSISDEDLNVFLTEINGIMSQYDEYSIRIWCFDTKVYNDQIFRSDEGGDITQYKPIGGGGTDFMCNFTYMKDNDITPKIFIMFTDMHPYGKWGDESYCENVIFVGYKSNGIQAPFGITITMD